MGVVDQEQEDVAVAGIEGRRVLGYLDKRVVGHRRPVERTGDFPAGVADTVAGDTHHRLNEFVIPDPAIVGAGHRAEFDAAVVGFERLDQLGAVRGEAVLQVDAGERRRQLAEIASWRTDQAAELTERPVGRRDRFGTAGDGEREATDVVGPRLDTEGLGLDGSGGGAFGAAANRVVQRSE